MDHPVVLITGAGDKARYLTGQSVSVDGGYRAQ
jgi:hypothetical protein